MRAVMGAADAMDLALAFALDPWKVFPATAIALNEALQERDVALARVAELESAERDREAIAKPDRDLAYAIYGGAPLVHGDGF